MVTTAQCHTQLFTEEVNRQTDLQNVHFMKNIIVVLFFINMLRCLLSIHFLLHHYHYHYDSQF